MTIDEMRRELQQRLKRDRFTHSIGGNVTLHPVRRLIYDDRRNAAGTSTAA